MKKQTGKSLPIILLISVFNLQFIVLMILLDMGLKIIDLYQDTYYLVSVILVIAAFFASLSIFRKKNQYSVKWKRIAVLINLILSVIFLLMILNTYISNIFILREHPSLWFDECRLYHFNCGKNEFVIQNQENSTLWSYLYFYDDIDIYSISISSINSFKTQCAFGCRYVSYPETVIDDFANNCSICVYKDRKSHLHIDCPAPKYYDGFDYDLYSDNISVWTGSGEPAFGHDNTRSFRRSDNSTLAISCNDADLLNEGAPIEFNLNMELSISGRKPIQGRIRGFVE